MAKALNFDTGVSEYDINGTAKVRFNPTDAEFVERLYNTFKTLEEQQDELQKCSVTTRGNLPAPFIAAYIRP